MLKEDMQEEGKQTHVYGHTHHTNTQTPPRGVKWLSGFQRGPKECQSQTNLGSKTERGTASPHLALGWVCVYRREKLINCTSVALCMCYITC